MTRRRRVVALRCFAFGTAFALSGCVLWPTMTRPAIRVSVQDPDGRPVGGASFRFARYTISMVPRSIVSETLTDAEGSVALDGEREWQLLLPVPDAGTFWSWSWCIDKPGYEAVLANDLRADGRTSATVVLAPTADRQRCVWREQSPAFEIRREPTRPHVVRDNESDRGR